MGQALNRVLREALNALSDHLDAQGELILDLQERVGLIEKGYLPRQEQKGQRAQRRKVVEVKVRPGPPLEKAVAVVRALLEEVGVGKTLDTLAGHLGVAQSSAGRILNVVQASLPHLIEVDKAGAYRMFWVPKGHEAQARAWLSEQTAQAEARAQALPKPVNGMAVLTFSEGRYILVLPTGRAYRASRSRDLKRKAKTQGYSVDDRVEASEPKTERPLAPVVRLRRV